jgi:hypothetical protein
MNTCDLIILHVPLAFEPVELFGHYNFIKIGESSLVPEYSPKWFVQLI